MARLMTVVECRIDAGGSDIHEHYLRIPLKSQSLCVLGSKTLGLNVLELHFVILANHDQNV